MTTNRSAITNLFKVADSRAAAVAPQDAIFPGNDAPVVRMSERVKWPRLFGQIFRLDKWIVCRG